MTDLAAIALTFILHQPAMCGAIHSVLEQVEALDARQQALLHSLPPPLPMEFRAELYLFAGSIGHSEWTALRYLHHRCEAV